MKRFVFSSLFLLLLTVVLWLTAVHHTQAAAGGATLYLAPNGTDTGDCTNVNEPCQTINYARQQSDPGDTIQLSAGTFSENPNLFTDLNVVGAGRNKTFVDGGQSGTVFSILGGPVRIADLTIQNGNAIDGGGIRNTDHLTLENVVIQHNYAPGSGGAIYNGGVLTITNSTIYSNTASTNSAGLINFGMVTISESTFQENVVLGLSYGGALHNNNGATLNLVNVTLSGNEAGSGAGISNSGDVNLLNVTLAHNVARNDFGGGISNFGVVNFQNTIVANNMGGDQCEGDGVFNSLGNNLENNNTCEFDQPTDLPSTSAFLRPLANTGGPTPTHSLLPDSPAIDAGDDGVCPAIGQRGVIRPLDGDDVPGAVCDIGAVEFSWATDGYKLMLPFITR